MRSVGVRVVDDESRPSGVSERRGGILWVYPHRVGRRVDSQPRLVGSRGAGKDLGVIPSSSKFARFTRTSRVNMAQPSLPLVPEPVSENNQAQERPPPLNRTKIISLLELEKKELKSKLREYELSFYDREGRKPRLQLEWGALFPVYERYLVLREDGRLRRASSLEEHVQSEQKDSAGLTQAELDASLEDAMELFVLPNADMILACVDADGNTSERFQSPLESDGSAGQYELVGPPRTLQMLAGILDSVNPGEVERLLQMAAVRNGAHRVADEHAASHARQSIRGRARQDTNSLKGLARGTLSPLHEVTIPQKSREAAGLPEAAAFFAFCYPAEGLEEWLEQVNVADNPWASALLVGGFAYFDLSRHLICVNALSLTRAPTKLLLLGPYNTLPVLAEELNRKGRLAAVTLDAMEEQGIKAFSWVHPNEEIVLTRTESSDGTVPFRPLSEDVDYPLGAFVYTHASTDPIFFILAAAPSPEPHAASERDGRLAHRPIHRFFVGLHARVMREVALARDEAQEVANMTREIDEGEAGGEMTDASDCSRARSKWRRKLALIAWEMLLVSTPTLAAMSLILVLGSLARYDARAFEVVATLVWFTLFVGTTWAPLRDTSGVAVKSHSRRRMLAMRAILATTPLLFGGVILIACAHPPGLNASCALSSDASSLL